MIDVYVEEVYSYGGQALYYVYVDGEKYAVSKIKELFA